MPTRRTILEVLMGGGALAAAGCASSGGPDPAAAWRNPGAGERDPRRWALAHAILAPNPHNRQPWLVDLPGTDEIVFYADTTRLLPATDPPNRQITLGCGAFLELLDLAARERGLRADITLWPQGEPQPVLDARPVAHVRLVADGAVQPDPLFRQITARHTSREPYDLASPPAANDLARVVAVAPSPLTAAAVTDKTGVERLIDIGSRGFAREMTTAAAAQESARLTRIGPAEIARHRDGIALKGPFLEGMAAIGLLTRETMGDPTSFATRSAIDMFGKTIAATPAFVWLKGPDNSRATQIASGRAYARMHLTATALGLSMQPWSMTLQEFPEMAELYRETQAALGASPQAPLQMLVRIGKAKPVEPAPRRGLAQHIRA
ncbi:Acg family FMN-binding oxidoreductase [Phenylobacterium sp.]|uniref:Acg family FMN-binding oxidoreductase n=1 Tax=Phenylobacterium sp. TaxID=1871053 RepID=UPI003BABAB2C